MYKYNNDVKKCLNNMIDASNNLADTSKDFYERNTMKFFNEYMSLPENKNRPLNAITYFDINSYLEAVPCKNTHKVNIYNSLKKFFEFTYKANITPDIITKANRPNFEKKQIKIISEDDYILLKEFVTNKENNLMERIVLGLFLFTGLSRRYIANMTSSQFVFENGIYKLSIIKSNEKTKKHQYFILPIKTELQLIINEYMLQMNEKDKKIITIDENHLSSYISSLTEKITNRKYTPTDFSNTFICNCLKEGNRVWEISHLVLESVSSIAKLLNEGSEELFLRQTITLNSF